MATNRAVHRRPDGRDEERPQYPSVVGVHFKVNKKIGEGSFGVIFEGKILLYFMEMRYPTLS